MMSELITHRIGIEGADFSFLQDRVLVSELEILEPTLAAELGYGEREVIVPTEPRLPTPQELEAILPDEHTKHWLRFTTLSASVGHSAMRHVQKPDFVMNPYNYVDLDGFRGAPMDSRVDPPGQLNVSKDGDNLLVGDHVDVCNGDASVTYAVLNMGPGLRRHRITPAFCRDDMNGVRPVPAARHAHFRKLLDSGIEPLSYWFTLAGPTVNEQGQSTVETLISPVARYLHEGSTYGLNDDSQAVFISVPPAHQL